MANVAGDSHDRNVPGVLGGNAAGGDGVFGEGGTSGRGVVGVSSGHTAVEGTTSSGIAVYGGVHAGAPGRGVVGVSGSSTAVEGNSTSGDAVYGVSKSGIGVHGKGGHLGGYFEGNVQITGDLSIQGVSIQAWLQRIITLENRANELQSDVNELEKRNG